MAIHWTIKAERQLRAALAEELCTAWGDAEHNAHSHDTAERSHSDKSCYDCYRDRLGRHRQRLDKVLTHTFSKSDVLVLDLMRGFRSKLGRFIFHVECLGRKRRGAYVVKIGPPDELLNELTRWNACRPEDLRHDLLLLPLKMGVTVEAEPSHPSAGQLAGPLASILYGAAHQFIGAEQITSLEDAFTESVLHGVPTPASVEFVLTELYERLAQLLYTQSFEKVPTNELDAHRQPKYVLEVKHLGDALKIWKQGDARQRRVEVNGSIHEMGRAGPFGYMDPMTYLERNALMSIHWRDSKGAIIGPATAAAGKADPPKVEELIPGMAVGCIHGDLHGRNVWVGRVRDRALWPAVFDYEDMSPCGLVGWDFVKMETELKIRLYPYVFPHELARTSHMGIVVQRFPETVQQFEHELARETETCNKNHAWPERPREDTRRERLRWLLLAIRRQAALHLGAALGRPNRWLEEYYFLLACYGICTVRYPNLQEKEHVGALVSAGVAASSLSYPWNFNKSKPQSLGDA